jgi:hypothetical protein
VNTRHAEIQNKIIDESGNKPYVKSFSQTGGTEHSGWKASNKHGKVKYFGKDFKASAMKHAGISEAADKHPIVKEYDALKKHDIKTLHGLIKQQSKVIDTSEFKTKDRAISHYLRNKHGHKKVDAAFGFKEDTAADREIGTDSLVKKYKKDTPGQKSNLDESFNMAWTSGIGVTLSAADCGIQIKGGFSLHPDVVDYMAEIEEDVVAADKKPVYVKPRRHKDGSFGKASTMMRRTGKKIIDVKEPEDVDSDEHDGK